MKIRIVGAGRIGGNLATQWDRRAHDVLISFKRDRDELVAMAAKEVAATLVRDTGFEPVDLGGWATISLLEAPHRPGAVYGEEYAPDAARRIAAAAATDLAEAGRLATELKEAG